MAVVSPDFTIRDEGSIVLLEPQTGRAAEWVGEHLPDDVMSWGRAVVIEHRYFPAVIERIIADGLVVR